jgi:subtilisin family serine protease
MGFLVGFFMMIGILHTAKTVIGRTPDLLETLILGLIGLILIFGTGHAHADHQPKFKIAIIDTGYDASLVTGSKLKLCKHGHYDFSKGQNGVGFTKKHGTAVASIIAEQLKDVDYCAVIYTISIYENAEQIVTAFYKASYETVDAINASYSGSIKSVAEREAVRDAAKRVKAIFVAAGNDGRNLDVSCLAFPTCFDIPNVHPVGALKANGARLPVSNYGSKVKEWYSGEASLGFIPATSFAAPRALSSYVLSLVNQQ